MLLLTNVRHDVAHVAADAHQYSVSVQVIAGGHHSAALDQEGCLYLWGRTFTAYPHAHAPFTAQPPETCQQAFAVQAQRHAATLTTAQPSICRWKQVP